MEDNPKYTLGNPERAPFLIIRQQPRRDSVFFNAVVHDAGGRTVGNWPCFRPPWGRLIAVNVNTGDFAWEVPLGVTDTLPEGKRK